MSIATPLPMLTGIVDVVTTFDGIDRRVLDDEATITMHAVVSVRGWAVERSKPALVGSIELLVDGKKAGSVRRGLARPDVVRHFDDDALLESGFAASISASAMGSGAHLLTIRITDQSGHVCIDLPPRRVTIEAHEDAAAARRRLPEGRLQLTIDHVDDELSLKGVATEHTLWRFRVGIVEGIARDLELGAACGDVHVVLDDESVYSAIVGYRSGSDRAGYKALIPTDDLEAGEHALRVVAFASDGTGFASSAEYRFNLVPFGTRPAASFKRDYQPTCHIQTFAFGREEQSGTRVPVGEPVYFRGWILDRAGKQVDLAYLLIDGKDAVDVALGQERPDLADSIGPEARFAGFVASCSTQSLATGIHHVRIVALSGGLTELAESRDAATFELT